MYCSDLYKSSLFLYTNVYACMHACMYVCMYVWTYTTVMVNNEFYFIITYDCIINTYVTFNLPHVTAINCILYNVLPVKPITLFVISVVHRVWLIPTDASLRQLPLFIDAQRFCWSKATVISLQLNPYRWPMINTDLYSWYLCCSHLSLSH